MDFSFKNILNNADFKPQKPGQVAISNMLSLFEGLTNLGGLKMPSTQEGYNVDKEVAIRNQRMQISSQITALAAEQMVRVIASMMQPEPVDPPMPISNPS